jgi:2-succinyl-6-hydroxy-2,4-cyclohexadiene-1-carboxylate synthase
VPAFTAAGFRCVTYDLRGWGRSKPAPGTDAGYMGDDLEALVEHLGIERVMLVAAAYGGFGALDYALRLPARVRALVVATSFGGVVDPEYMALRERLVGPELQALPIEVRELGPSYRAEDPDGVARWLRILHEAGGERAARQAQRTRVTLAGLETLQVPTLLVAGGADLLAPPPLMRLMAARIPGCELATVAEAGHSAHWERPAEWNRIVLGFLRRH